MVVGGWWGGVHSHFHVQPNDSVEVVLCCRWECDNKDEADNYFNV